MPLVEIMDTVVPDSLSPWKAVPPYIARRIDGALITDGLLYRGELPIALLCEGACDGRPENVRKVGSFIT